MLIIVLVVVDFVIGVDLVVEAAAVVVAVVAVVVVDLVVVVVEAVVWAPLVVEEVFASYPVETCLDVFGSAPLPFVGSYLKVMRNFVVAAAVVVAVVVVDWQEWPDGATRSAVVVQQAETFAAAWRDCQY